MSNFTILVSYFHGLVFSYFEKLLPKEPDSAFKLKKSSCVVSLTLYGSPGFFF